MAINFPDSPSNGDTTILDGKTYTYDSTSTSWAPAVGDTSATTIYSDMAALIAATGMSAGDQALVTALNKVFMYTGSAWFLIATMTNASPTAITGVDGTYTLAEDGTATTITAVSTDPEGFPLTWSYAVTTGSLGSTATVSQADNVFTVTPSSTEADAGSFSITFSVTDGATGAVQTVSAFTLSFSENNYFIDPRDYGMSTAQFSGCGINSNDENLYVLGYSGDQRVYKWELGTPAELESIPNTYTQRADITDATPGGFYINHAGTYYYYCGYSTVYQVSLSTAHDLTTGTTTTKTHVPSGNPSISDQEIDNGGMIFGGTMSHTGHRLYISETTNQTIREHPLNTNWNISTIQNATNTFNPNNISYAYGLGWSSDGMKLWCAESRYIYEYSASSAYSLSGMGSTPTASFDTQNLNNNVNNYTANNISNPEIRGISVSSDGNRLYLNLRAVGVFKLTMVTQDTIADGFGF